MGAGITGEGKVSPGEAASISTACTWLREAGFEITSSGDRKGLGSGILSYPHSLASAPCFCLACTHSRALWEQN